VDRYGFKRFHLLGMGLLAGGALIYGLAPSWQVIIAAIILLSISMRLIGTGCSVICADSVRTFYDISSGVAGAMTLELVPVEQVGRWSGLLGLFRGLVTIPAPILGGLIWKGLDPAHVFMIPVALDLLLKLPLLTTIPETLDQSLRL